MQRLLSGIIASVARFTMMQSRPLAIVTGARRGIGAAIAIALAGRGFDLALTDLDFVGADAVLAQAQGQGAAVSLHPSDLGQVAGHADLVGHIVGARGPITCLVNNAGVSAAHRGDLLELGVESFDHVLDVNLRGTFFFTQAVARHMVATPVQTSRSIVTVSSVSAEMASIARGEYCVSKAGLGMLTKLFALRLAPLGIGVFEVRPGIIRTPMTEPVAGQYEQRLADGLVPMGRWGQAQDVARAVAALAGGELGFSTGSVVHVDGALSIPRF
jgi:NAD(P)-dependent dehydrogenase (short-subunit alcohol dehydrogenase family)